MQLYNVNKEYILDEESNSRSEYFLIINTGNEEDQKMFFLTSEDISKEFWLNEHEDKYTIPSRKVFSSKYEIQNRKHCLDRIEESIRCAEFYKNRCFIFSKLTPIKPNFDVILPDYKENIEHQYGNIPDLFKEQKEEAFDAILQIEEVYDLLKKFVESIDPIEACYIAEKVKNRFGEAINLPEIFNKDFYYNLKNHKEMVDNLRNDGVLDNYISLRKCIIIEINSFLQGYLIDNITNNDTHDITIKYDPVNFKFVNVLNSITTIPENQLYKVSSKFIKVQEGLIVFSWKIGLQTIHSKCLKMNDCCLIEIMEKIYTLKYYAGHEI